MADRPAPPDGISFADGFSLVDEGLCSRAPGSLLLDFVPTSQTVPAMPGSGARRG